MDVTGPLRFDQRQTIDAYELQIRDIQSLLKVQINETSQCHQHIDILNRETDALRCIIEEKQNLVHQLQNQLKKRKDAHTELEIKYEQSKIDHLAFFDLEQQNLQLLEQLKEKQIVVDELQVENRYLREQRDDRLVVEETKAKKMNELEVTFPYERTQLQVRLDHAQNVNNHQAMKIMQLQAQVNNLQSRLSYKEQLSSEQLTRAKQSEYKALLQLDQRDMIMSTLEKQHDELAHSSAAIGQRAKELTAQLDHTLHTAQYAENVYTTVIDTLEQDHLSHTIQQRMTARINSALTLETQVAAELLQSILSEDGRSMKPKKQLTVPQSPSFGATRRSPLSKFDQQQQQQWTPPRSSATATVTLMNSTRGTNRSKSVQLLSPNGDNRVSAPTTATPKYHRESSHSQSKRLSQESLSSPLQIDIHSPTASTRQARKQREERVGTALLHSPAARSSFTAMALPAGAGAVAEVTTVQEARVMLLHRYMRLFCLSLMESGGNAGGAELDLQQCQVNDRDVDIIIDWLRTLSTGSYRSISSIVLRQNKLSGVAVEKLITLLLSLAAEDITARIDAGPMLIDLQYNNINEKDISKNIDMLQSSTGKAAGVLKAELLDSESQTLCLYLAGGKPTAAILVAKIDMSRQQSQDRRPRSGLKYGEKLVRLSYDDRPLAHPEQMIGTFTTATYATGEEELDASAMPLDHENRVVPRDEVLKLPLRDY